MLWPRRPLPALSLRGRGVSSNLRLTPCSACAFPLLTRPAACRLPAAHRAAGRQEEPLFSEFAPAGFRPHRRKTDGAIRRWTQISADSECPRRTPHPRSSAVHSRTRSDSTNRTWKTRLTVPHLAPSTPCPQGAIRVYLLRPAEHKVVRPRNITCQSAVRAR